MEHDTYVREQLGWRVEAVKTYHYFFIRGADAGVIVGLDHMQLALPAGGEAAARRFYGEVLGLEEVAKPEALRARGGVWFVGPAFGLHLGVEADFRPARKAHPAFRVRDIEGVFERLEAAGCSPRWDDALPGVRRFYAHDPFGNRLEFLGANTNLSSQTR